MSGTLASTPSYGGTATAERGGSGNIAWSRSPRRFLLPAVELMVSAALLGLASAVGHVAGILSAVSLAIVGLGRTAVRWRARVRVVEGKALRVAARSIATVLLLWCLLLFAIRVIDTTSPVWKKIPPACGVPGCSRAVPGSMFRCDEGCSVPEFAVRRRDLFAELRERVGGTSRTRLLWSSPEAGFFSARVISAVFGFPDNLGVHVRCNGTQSQVNVAAELIVGHDDFRANAAHVRRVLRQSREAAVAVPQGRSCEA